jgi:hypothetical protein
VLACTHRKQIYHLSKTKQHACGPQNLQASACTPLEAHRLLSGTIIGCIQIMSLNISRHPSTRESKGKARSPTSKVIQDQIRIRPRLHLPAAQLRFARAQPRERAPRPPRSYKTKSGFARGSTCRLHNYASPEPNLGRGIRLHGPSTHPRSILGQITHIRSPEGISGEGSATSLASAKVLRTARRAH